MWPRVLAFDTDGRAPPTGTWHRQRVRDSDSESSFFNEAKTRSNSERDLPHFCREGNAVCENSNKFQKERKKPTTSDFIPKSLIIPPTPVSLKCLSRARRVMFC